MLVPMHQLVTRVDDRLVRELDALVAAGVFGSRSDAVRMALADIIDHHRRRLIGEAIVTGYEAVPQTDDELSGLTEATRALIEEEPW